jgi:hypothetical protein
MHPYLMTMRAQAADPYGTNFNNPFSFPSDLYDPYVLRPVIPWQPPPQHAPQPAQPIQRQTPAPSPSDLERLIGGVIQVASVLAEGYVKFVLLPNLNAEVHIELKEAVRKNRLEDVIGLVAVKNILDKLSDS